VTERTYETTSLAELARADGWSPIRLSLEVKAFGINAWTAHELGAAVIPAHDERPTGHEELYLVTAGRATFTVEGEEVDAPAGTIVFVRDPAATREAVAQEPATTVLSVGGKPGEPYRPLAWETNRDVIALLTDALDRYEDRSSILYNLACTEAQLGETEAALEHLRAALDARPSFAEAAREDSDLEPIRDDPRFAEVVGSL
jgi:tetratricopeptide (TPR) repeat protein